MLLLIESGSRTTVAEGSRLNLCGQTIGLVSKRFGMIDRKLPIVSGPVDSGPRGHRLRCKFVLVKSRSVEQTFLRKGSTSCLDLLSNRVDVGVWSSWMGRLILPSRRSPPCSPMVVVLLGLC